MDTNACRDDLSPENNICVTFSDCQKVWRTFPRFLNWWLNC